MLASLALPALFLATLAAAIPTKTLAKRTTCGQWDSIQTGTYTIYNDLWGESGATSGGSCINVDSLNGNTVAWHTNWTWVGGNGVKAFPNAVVTLTSKQLSAINSMPSTWNWGYTGCNLVADVAYDIFTSATAGGSNAYEIMIWLAAIGGAGPISSSYGSNGQPTPVNTTTIAGHSFNLYKGPNGATTVFSFLPASGVIQNFSGDIKAFLTFLINNQGLPSSQYLVSVGAGTEPTTGENALFEVSGYSVTIN